MVNFSIQSNATLLEAELDKGLIEVGESVYLRVKLPGDLSGVEPLKYPSVPGLKIEYACMQQSLQIINGRSSSGVEFLFMVSALKKGRYQIPGFVFKRGEDTLQSRGVTLAVSSERSRSAGTGIDVVPSVELSAAAAYVGQPVVMRYYIRTSGIKATMRYFEHLPDTKGFVIKRIDDLDSGTSQNRQSEYEKIRVASYALIPAGPGAYQVGGGDAVFSMENPMAGSRPGNFFGFNFPDFFQTKTLNFETRPLAILPLPRQGMPADFHGDIGRFTLRVEYTNDPVKIYEEKRVTVTLEGSGNLITMTRPLLEKEMDGLKIISEEGESSIKIDGWDITGSRKFIYTLIPEKPGSIDAGGVKFSFFDPTKGRYETIRSRNVSFSAKSDGSRSGFDFDREGDNRIDFNPLYFVFIALALAGTIFFVILWERKRLAIVSESGPIDEEAYNDRRKEERCDYQADLAGCLQRGDGDFFLKVAEKWIDQSLKELDAPAPDRIESSLNKIRDEIHRFKFGGGKIALPDMQRIYEEITAVREH